VRPLDQSRLVVAEGGVAGVLGRRDWSEHTLYRDVVRPVERVAASLGERRHEQTPAVFLAAGAADDLHLEGEVPAQRRVAAPDELGAAVEVGGDLDSELDGVADELLGGVVVEGTCVREHVDDVAAGEGPPEGLGRGGNYNRGSADALGAGWVVVEDDGPALTDRIRHAPRRSGSILGRRRRGRSNHRR